MVQESERKNQTSIDSLYVIDFIKMKHNLCSSMPTIPFFLDGFVCATRTAYSSTDILARPLRAFNIFERDREKKV